MIVDTSSNSQTRSTLGVLSLARDEEGHFRSCHLESNPGGTIFGGVLIGQMVSAATQALDGELTPHHVQLVFVSAGDPTGDAVRYQVDTLHAGRSFTMRQVIGRQGGRTIVSGQVSFHRPETGPAHQDGPAATPPDPESLPTLREVALTLEPTLGSAARRLISPGSAELRFVNAEQVLLRRQPGAQLLYWVRLRETIPDSATLHAQALAYLSDFWFPLTALLPHLDAKVGHGLHITSLNHAIWFHRPCRADEWLWVEATSPASTSARGLSLGRIYDRNGCLVASLAQENLFRGWVHENGQLVAPRTTRRASRPA